MTSMPIVGWRTSTTKKGMGILLFIVCIHIAATASSDYSEVTLSLGGDGALRWTVKYSSLEFEMPFVVEEDVKTCPSAGSIDDYFRDPKRRMWTSGVSYISLNTRNRCERTHVCPGTMLNRYYAEIPTCSCGLCVDVAKGNILWDVSDDRSCEMKKERVGDSDGATWIVGSHGCLAAATALRPDSAKATADETIVLYRLIGNDMPPLESKGQLKLNTEYALRNEPTTFKNLRLRWIINRVVSESEADELRNAILEEGSGRSYESQDIVYVPFDADVMCSAPSERLQMLYESNQNGARNAAYRHAYRDGFRWILIFDGNGFITTNTWFHIASALSDAEERGQRAMEVPMVRVFEPQSRQVLNESTAVEDIFTRDGGGGRFTTGAFAEAQIAVRRDLLPPGTVPYDPRISYGKGNKLGLLSLCGDRYASQVEALREKYLAVYWPDSTCYCADELGRSEYEIGFLAKTIHVTPGEHGELWNGYVDRVMAKNRKTALRCGVWIRLYIWPDAKEVGEIFRAHAHDRSESEAKCHASRIPSRATVEDRQCRYLVRRAAHEQFGQSIRSRCSEISTASTPIDRDRARAIHLRTLSYDMNYVAGCFCDWTDTKTCARALENRCEIACCAAHAARVAFLHDELRRNDGSRHYEDRLKLTIARRVYNALNTSVATKVAVSNVGGCDCRWAEMQRCSKDFIGGDACYEACCVEAYVGAMDATYGRPGIDAPCECDDHDQEPWCLRKYSGDPCHAPCCEAYIRSQAGYGDAGGAGLLISNE